MTAKNVISSRKKNVAFPGKLFLNRELYDNIYCNQFIKKNMECQTSLFNNFNLFLF